MSLRTKLILSTLLFTTVVFGVSAVFIMDVIFPNSTSNLSETSLKTTFDQIHTLWMKDSLVLLMVLIAIGVSLSVMIERFVIRPLSGLQQAINDFNHGDRSEKEVVCHSNDEVGELVDDFNVMLTKLKTREKQRQYSLKTSESERALFKNILDTTECAHLVTDQYGDIIYCSRAVFQVFGKPVEDILGRKINSLIRTKTQYRLKDVIEKGLTLTDIDVHSLVRDEKLKMTTRHLSQEKCVLFSLHNMTDMEQALYRNRIAARVFESSQDGLLVLDHDGKVSMMNSAVSTLLGIEPQQYVGRPFVYMLKRRSLRNFMPSITESIEHYGMWQGEVVEHNAQGDIVPMFVRVNRITQCEQNERYDWVIILTDMSKVKEMERLEHLALHDALTGLANRSKFSMELEKLVQRSGYQRTEFAIIYLDLDGFKTVNDTYGHDAGDEVLKIVANRLTSVTRHSDVIARLAGDEFVILINPANQMIVTRISNQLLESICMPIEHKGETLKVGVSIGVKLVGVNEKDATKVLKSADTAMYQAKKAGKGQAILADCE